MVAPTYGINTNIQQGSTMLYLIQPTVLPTLTEQQQGKPTLPSLNSKVQHQHQYSTGYIAPCCTSSSQPFCQPWLSPTKNIAVDEVSTKVELFVKMLCHPWNGVSFGWTRKYQMLFVKSAKKQMLFVADADFQMPQTQRSKFLFSHLHPRPEHWAVPWHASCREFLSKTWYSHQSRHKDLMTRHS